MKKGIRILAIVLTVACLLGLVAVAAADSISLNLNGDKNGKGEDIVNLWDAQEALYGDKVAQTDRMAYLQAINGKILGRVTSTDNTYYIFTAADLACVQSDKAAKYVLMNDIDLKGADWMPVADFAGEFDGNGCTISNFTVAEAVDADLGFFADTTYDANIHDLHLADFTVDVPAQSTAQYIGSLVGTNRGIVSNCTVDGRMIDSRTTVGDSAAIYRGILVGRHTSNEDHAETTAITLGSMNTYAYDGEVRRDNADCSVASVMAFDLPEGTTCSQYGDWFVGIKGGSAKNYDSSAAVWRDTSNSTKYDSDTTVAKRMAAVQYMKDMGTVQWKPSELLFYLKKGSDGSYSGRYFSPDYTYTGIPYNGGMGDLERALSVMTEQEDGTYVLNADMTDGYQVSNLYGFVRYLGSDCSSAMLLAWQRASHSNIYADGVASAGKYQGIAAFNTEHMIPNSTNYVAYGVLPVGYSTEQTSTVEIIQEMTGSKGEVRDFDLSELSVTYYPHADDYTAMAEYYAAAKMGDGMLYRESSGHARLLACDPVVIRNNAGVIDLHRSYMVTHEQGDGMYNPENDAVTEKQTYSGTVPNGDTAEVTLGTKLTSWRINHEYTFEELLKGTYNNGQAGRDKSTGMKETGGGYVPITMSAYTHTGNDATWIDAKQAERANDPILYSHYRVVSATMIIQDGSGKEVFRLKRYNDVDYSQEETKGFRDKDAGKTVQLNRLFPDYDELLTQSTGMTWEEMTAAGYKYTFELELSSGRLAKMTDTGTYAWQKTGLTGTLEALGQLPKVTTNN